MEYAHSFLSIVNEEFQDLQNEVKAQQMSAYMKHRFSFLGIQTPIRREVFNRLWSTEKTLIREHWRAIVTACWLEDNREYQMLGLDILSKIKKHLIRTDIVLLEDLILKKSWWDTVDFIASTMVGEYFNRFPQEKDQLLLKWNQSNNIWLIRTSIIFQLKYKDRVDLTWLSHAILTHQDSREFFIQKASGWALRQHSKLDPNWVRDFIESNPGLSKLTKREGLKYVD